MSSTAHPPGLLHRTWAPLVVGAGGVGLATALALRDPHVPGSWGHCVFLSATGWWCPGCGGLRAVNDLLHLDVAGALSSNAAGVVLIGLLSLWWVGWAWSAATRRPVAWDRWVTGGNVTFVLGAWLVYAVLRNLPGLEALGP